ncbi:MAG TPA: pyroglutamyl-peptidase I [Clostridiales bacterium]|nr:pyroglutamyl-peptidase I [Clostridiales bacterium]
MKILVTGFKPFGGERINPSEEVVRRLPAALGGVELVSLILPVERRESVAQAAQAIRTHRPQAVVSIGQAGGRSAVTVERVAINLDDFSIPDQKGEQPRGEPVAAEGPDAYLCRLPVEEMVGAIRARGVPAALSLSAGTYVCNHLMYAVCHLMARELPQAMGGGFIHIPYLPQQVLDKPQQPSMTLEQSLLGVEAALEALASGMA